MTDPLAGLFSGNVRVLHAPIAPGGSLLTPAESRYAESMGVDRRAEFATGRALARRALVDLGAPLGDLLPDADRAPVWPEGFCGSIAHARCKTRSLCAVAVAPLSDQSSLGLDIECDRALSPGVVERVVTPTEARSVAAAGCSVADVAVLFFSAKEAVYKAQFPVTRTFLDFPDVEVRLDPDGLGFHATLQTGSGQASFPHTVSGRLFRGGGLVAAGLQTPALPAGPE